MSTPLDAPSLPPSPFALLELLLSLDDGTQWAQSAQECSAQVPQLTHDGGDQELDPPPSFLLLHPLYAVLLPSEHQTHPASDSCSSTLRMPAYPVSEIAAGATEAERSPLLRLPRDVLHASVLPELCARDVCATAQVCRDLRDLSDMNDALWEQLFRKRFATILQRAFDGNIPSPPPLTNGIHGKESSAWKEFYFHFGRHWMTLAPNGLYLQLDGRRAGLAPLLGLVCCCVHSLF